MSVSLDKFRSTLLITLNVQTEDSWGWTGREYRSASRKPLCCLQSSKHRQGSYRLPGNQAGRRILSEGFPVKPLLVFVLVCECCLLSSSNGAARKVGEFRALTEVMNTADLCVKARCQLY